MQEISSGNISDLTGQMFMIGIGGEQLSPEEESFISEFNIGFVILFSRNTKDPERIKALTAKIHKTGKVPPLIFIDQEGGPVVRLGESSSTFISHMGLAATGRKCYSKTTGRIMGREMRMLGIDGIFAPVLDVNSRKDNPVIGIRSFSDNHRTVEEFGMEFIRGLKQGGVISCPKHFPGHGDTSMDSHYTLPVTDISSDLLNRIHVSPFKRVVKKGIKAIMTAHVRYKKIDSEPGTFSRHFLTGLLREKMNFQGVIFSDCLEMKAIKDNYSSEEVIAKGINSGIDVFSVSHTPEFAWELIRALKNLSGKDPGTLKRIYESVERIRTLKNSLKKRPWGKDISLRKELKTERKIALRSVTVVKNKKSVIPLNPNTKLLVLNMKRSLRSTDFSTGVERVSLESIIKKRFHNFELLETTGDKKAVDVILKKISSYQDVVLINYSSGGGMGSGEKRLVKEVLSLKKESVLVAAHSPFILEYFPGFSSMIATFGFRMVQMEALFAILGGYKKPRGKMPVNISL